LIKFVPNDLQSENSPCRFIPSTRRAKRLTTAIISHGGPALNKSALMPAWGNTLSKSDIQALMSYLRAISDPPHRGAGPVYTKN